MFGIAIYRFFYATQGEQEISMAALENTVYAMSKVFAMRLEKDLALQSQVANLWALDKDITRAKFRQFIMSPAFEPALQTMSGMSLIPYVLNADRAAFEARAETQDLLEACCNSTVYDNTASACRDKAATLCELGRYSILESVNGSLAPSPAQDAYVVVDYIEPFESNAGVLGFNLASSATRKEAWEQAVDTGLAVFTRRIQLVQSNTKEFAFLVWKAVFEGEVEGTFAFKEESPTSVPRGSVNGVYKAQQFLSGAMAIFGTSELANLDIFLFDTLAPAGQQFLAVYSESLGDPLTLATTFEEYTPEDIVGEFGTIQRTINISGADAEMMLVVRPNEAFFREKASDAPQNLLIWSMLLILASQAERHLGYLAAIANRARMLNVQAISKRLSS
ncbi:Hypothetical Protein FCC1311_025112 [Hondaea fermentalgiana]|uniref:CHASE domain-containing protein n=1 Tax=Hondaea fermentalgiana TaxID=2315210 RepID=A0A2R5G5N0_9STRA|nr:Hypothetical Protein FCC1311_025112 [Hondaea fermentalgiana]|eukprot:GBG26290.1 Hypothetical Protein FCC1311_025112 [Hondaea fermentalgiana]